MALTVEELQIVLSCDATTAQTVLKQMEATVKAYTDKFQSYFDKLGMDKNPKTIVGDVKAVEKQLDNVTKAIESKGKDWKAAYAKTWGETVDESMRKARMNSRKTSGYVPTGNKYIGDPTSPWANRDTVLQNSAEVARMTFGNMRANKDIVGLGGDVFATLGGKLEEVGNLTAAVRMKVIDARNAVQKFGQAYVSAAENFGADAKDTLKVEEKFKKAIVAADKYVQQLDKVIAKEQEQAQAAASAAAQRRAEQLALEAQARVEAALRQQRIAATTATIQAEHEPSRVLAPSMGDVFSGFSESASGAFTSIRSRASEAFSFIKSEVGELTSEMSSDFSTAGNIIQGVFLGVKMIFKGIVAAIRGVINAVKRVGSAIKKAFSHSLLGRFLKRLGSVMMRMAAMALIRGTIDGVKKGLEELAKTSESSAKAMNSIKAAGGSIKMALGAAVMPIVKALVPWFYKLAGVVTSAANVIAQFFARVTGQERYTAVTLSEGLDDVSSSAGNAHKNMKSVLADFDELVVISKSSGGGGGGSTGVDSSFSTVSDKLAFSELGDRIRQQIIDGNWAGVGGAIAEKLNSSIEDWNPETSATKISEKIKNALDLAIGFLENFDARQLGEKISLWFQSVDWSGIASSISELLGAALGGLGAFLAGLFSDAWQSVKDWFNSYSFDEDGNFIISGFFEGIGNALKDIGKWIKENIFDPFISGFKLAFGISSPAKEMNEPGEMVGEGILAGIVAPFKAIGEWITNNIVDPIKNWFKKNPLGEVASAGIGLLQSGWDTVSSWIKKSHMGEALKKAVNLARNGWTTITNWIKDSFFGDKLKKPVNLARNSWTTITEWINKSFMGKALNKGIGVVRSGWDSITSWIKSTLMGGKLAKDIGVAKNGWDTITSWIKANFMGDALTKGIGLLRDKWTTVAEWVRDKFLGGVVTVTVTLKEGFKKTWNAAVEGVNRLFGTNLPTLAKGGIAFGPTTALVGEYAGAKADPEVIAPLSSLVSLLTKANAQTGGTTSDEEIRLMREQNAILRQLLSKKVEITPSVQLGQVIDRSQKLYART